MPKFTLIFKVFCSCASLFFIACKSGPDPAVTWRINSLSELKGNPVTVWGVPVIIETEGEEAVEFNGRDTGILVDSNPISDLEEFKIEVVLKPYSGYPENVEQRFLHIQDPNNEDRRILIELRLNDREEWYGDWFIKSEKGSLALLDSTRTFPVDEWATIALEYKNGEMSGFINGEHQISGKIEYLPIGAQKGKTSIGTRMDKRSWFKGLIREIRFYSGR